MLNPQEGLEREALLKGMRELSKQCAELNMDEAGSYQSLNLFPEVFNCEWLDDVVVASGVNAFLKVGRAGEHRRCKDGMSLVSGFAAIFGSLPSHPSPAS